ncbi:aminotransferase class I/II-fold pyridoxal phosphate-dependent enzyme [Ornithinibacillus sp. JPR2-1]|uniref:aminotransferase class I/II-fold pyridoxal phosphate-dependent enzyme n=1 Tax=Ornithinibacillus sp. JPR2-1 TaxID=2094019 RepID=UPI0031D21A2A
MNHLKELVASPIPLLNQDKMPLFDSLVEYAKQDVTPFDVPGHKMGSAMSPLKEVLGEMALRMDVNSMKELDLLSHPQSVIKEAQDLAADAFGAEHAYFLVNGTTVGIQTMIMATCKPGDTLLVPRNGHKSVMDGIILSGARPVFMSTMCTIYDDGNVLSMC